MNLKYTLICSNLEEKILNALQILKYYSQLKYIKYTISCSKITHSKYDYRAKYIFIFHHIKHPKSSCLVLSIEHVSSHTLSEVLGPLHVVVCLQGSGHGTSTYNPVTWTCTSRSFSPTTRPPSRVQVRTRPL